ncbi:MAG: hypothetical protein ABSH01_04135 [Terriglobia bacterium]
MSAIRGEQLNFEAMVQRAQIAGDAVGETFLKSVRDRLAEIEQRVAQETNIDELDGLIDDAEQQGQLRAYICPHAEIADEGNLDIDVMEEWNVPKTVIARLRASLGKKLENADKDVESARSALRALFEEFDSWASYTSEYEKTMRSITLWLFGVTIVLLLLAILAFHFPRTILGGLLCAGAAGSCVSVMAKMPALDVSLSGELDAYQRRIFSRIAVGIVASLIGSALLGWGLFPISIQNQSFTDMLNACAASPAPSCTGLKTLILLGIPMLFGFSERALTSFERRVFGDLKGGRAKR